MVVKSSAVKDTGRFLGLLTFAQSGGTFLGPIIGGALYAKVGYRAVFAWLLATMSVDFILRAFLVEKDTRRPVRSSDSPTETTPFLRAQRSPSHDETRQQEDPSGWGKPLFRSVLQSPRVVTGLFGTFALVSLDTALDTVSKFKLVISPANTSPRFWFRSSKRPLNGTVFLAVLYLSACSYPTSSRRLWGSCRTDLALYISPCLHSYRCCRSLRHYDS